MKILKRFAGFMLALFLFVGCFAFPAKAASTELKTGIAFVNAGSLRLRSNPSTSSQTLDYASRDEVVVLLGKSGEWYKVNYNLQTGYMHSKYLNVSLKENVELGYGEVTGNNVSIRNGAGTSYAKIDSASIQDRAYIIGINNQWFKVIYGNNIGYIRSDYLQLCEIPYENRDSAKEPLFFRKGQSTGIAPSAKVLHAENSAQIALEILATAKQYIGVPYVWGGSTPSGFDCSGYVQYVYRLHGYTLPRTSKEQFATGSWVSKSNLQAGDLVFFNTSGNGVSHVGIYIGNDQFIHASSSKGVMISYLSNSYWDARYYGARKVL